MVPFASAVGVAIVEEGCGPKFGSLATCPSDGKAHGETQMPMVVQTFFAYSSSPDLISETVERAVLNLREKSGITNVQSWRQLDIAGRFVADQVLNRINESAAFVGDITQLNFNVAYEIGFALAKGKKVVLTKHKGVRTDPPLVKDVGIFDTLGYTEYQNADELEAILRSLTEAAPSIKNIHPLNQNAPVYLIEARLRTDPVTRIVSRVKKARLFFRSFDPQESPRLPGSVAFEQVAQSFGVLLHLLPDRISDAAIHNIQAAFLGGLAEGFGKVLSILQDGEDPVPLDYRDLVTVFFDPSQIDEAIAEFAPRVMEAMQENQHYPPEEEKTLLEKVSFGASAAENEFRELQGYYLATDQFQRALRGEVRLVVGRKGSGKTAIFVQVRDRVRHTKGNVVLDLRPDGYQLIKFKEMVLKFLGSGALEHTVTAFWEYLLLLEVCHKLLQKDRIAHMREARLLQPYRRLAALYQSDEYITEGDFSERLSDLLQHITNDYQAKYGDQSSKALSQQEITHLLYRHDVNELRTQVIEYLRLTDSLMLLFDNIDKGWPTQGLTATDVSIVRALLEATRKLERQLERRNVKVSTLVFLRNDVYELLVAETPDRGKEGHVVLDWSDPDLLREMIRRRLLYSYTDPLDSSLEQFWPRICVSHIKGEESFQYLIDRSLMRPRALIDLSNYCHGFAVNLKHAKIETSDIEKGLAAFSSDLVKDIGFEIRDVAPDAENVLYAFIDEPQTLPATDLRALLERGGIVQSKIDEIIRLLLWFAVLGVRRQDGSITYIYTVNYEMPILAGIMRKLEPQGLVYVINPAFVPGLQIREDGN